MRSSRSAAEPSNADPLDPGASGFAHRGLHGPDAPENSLAAFAAAIALGCGIECDVRRTADDQLIIFHDADARRLCGDPLEIGRATLAQIGGLRLGGRPIPTLADLLALVDGRVPLLLEAKVDGDAQRFARVLREQIAGYRGRCGAMSFDPRFAHWLKRHAPGVRRGLVVRNDLSSLRRWVLMRLADPDFLAIDRRALGQAWSQRARRRIPLYSWTVATREQRRVAQPLCDALIWEADGRP